MPVTRFFRFETWLFPTQFIRLVNAQNKTHPSFTGQDIRIPHDENTKIDRPAHVGDHIQSWLNHRDRAVVIRNLNGNGR